MAKVLRARAIPLEESIYEPWVIVADHPAADHSMRFYQRAFPIVLEFYDTETGEVTPVELVGD